MGGTQDRPVKKAITSRDNEFLGDLTAWERSHSEDNSEQLERLRRNLAKVRARELTPRAALLKMRTFVPRYLKHLDGARGLRQHLIQCTDWAEFDDIINVIASGEQA